MTVKPVAPLVRGRQAEMYRRALRIMPGGADSNFRIWDADTVYIDRGKGAMIWDIDGNEYIDLRMGYGPAILGHADERVDAHVIERLARGISFSLTSEDEVQACELITELTFCDMARLTVSGTEATMHAMRLARAFTGRDRIIKFEGGYHGVHDYALASPDEATELGQRDDPLRFVQGRGIPEVVAQTVIPVPFNDTEAVQRVFAREGERIAAVIVEPVLGNAQALLPDPGFLEGIRALTNEYGALLIFDEVKTGFRLARGGAAELFGVTPDLATYAKALANGYPAAAFGGRRDVMSLLPERVSHGGTYAGNRIAASAAVATLRILRDTDALAVIDGAGRRLQAGLHEVMTERSVPHAFSGHPIMFGIVFAEAAPSDYRGWVDTDHDLYDDVAWQMILRGAMPEPDSREPWFLSESHAAGDIIDRVVGIFEVALDAALEARAGAGAAASPANRPTAGQATG